MRARRSRPLSGAVTVVATVLAVSTATGAVSGVADAAPVGAAASAGSAPGAVALLATPLLSPSRVPETLQALDAQQDLTPALQVAMSGPDLGPAAAAQSCAEVAQDGRVIFSDHANLPVLPASNMKLLTATALLDKLGAGYTFQTRLEAASPPVGGVVQGNLYLVGGGDPLLRLSSYAATIVGGDKVYTNVAGLASMLKASGVDEVTGSVVGDDSRYDSQRSVAAWPARYAEQGDVGELSALGIDDGFALGGAPVPDSAPPAQQSAGVVTALLGKAGVEVQGAPEAGQAPAGAHSLVTLTSPPLGAVLGEVLRESDNTAMELLTKELGLRQEGTGSTAAGTEAVRADLAADGMPMSGFANVDGSGLATSDRVTCALLLAALERSGPHGLLVQDLPVAARSGTLADELKGTVAAGRVRAKTGTLDDVKALSGWVEPLKGQGGGNPVLAQPVAFAAVLNGLAPTLPRPTDTPAGLTDRVALDIAMYPQAPALAEFEP